MTNKRKDCPMRYENGNCTIAGGFCTAVNDQICEALHNAFDCGHRSALRQRDHFREVTKKVEPLTLDELRKMDETVWVCYPQPTFGTNLLTEHMDCTRYKFSFAEYGKTWVAYRRKPEEDDHENL